MEEECTLNSFNQRFMLEEIFQTLSSAFGLGGVVQTPTLAIATIFVVLFQS